MLGPRARLVASVVVALALGGCGGHDAVDHGQLSADGSTWTITDPRDDLTQHDTVPPPCGTDSRSDTADDGDIDLTDVEVTHRSDAIVAEVSFAAMPVARARFALTVDDARGRYFVRVDAVGDQPSDDPSDRVSVDGPTDIPSAGHECGDYLEFGGPAPCEGAEASVDVAARRAMLVMPVACVGDPDWVAVTVNTSYRGHGRDVSDTTGDESPHLVAAR